ncbi:hypothetical protein TI05_17405 [Achromatium sp. WMS3]|nr:hypothetical protein TI05_17405 [Achromatium sp. WMS3]
MQVKTQYDPQWALFHNKSTLETIDEKFKTKISELELKVVEQDKTITELEQTNTKLTQEIKILKFVSKDEEAYRSLVHAMVGGEREVYIGGIYPGRVDIVTDNMIIEVKRTEEFEKGFGQLRRRVKCKLRCIFLCTCPTSCPQAASISPPLVLRVVAMMPPCNRRCRNSSIRVSEELL